MSGAYSPVYRWCLLLCPHIVEIARQITMPSLPNGFTKKPTTKATTGGFQHLQFGDKNIQIITTLQTVTRKHLKIKELLQSTQLLCDRAVN